MAVHFVDSETGEILDEPQTRRAARANSEPEGIRVNITPVIIVMAFVIGFFIGGSVASVIGLG